MTAYPEGEWSLEQAAAVMLDMAVDGASVYADTAFLEIEPILRSAGSFDALPEDSKLFAQRVLAQLQHNMASVADRIADFAEWTPEQRAELHRRRLAVYVARLNDLQASVGLQGTA